MTQIAFLGLGAMGSRMATRLVGAGFSVTVWNRDAAKAAPLGEAGAQIAGTPRAAAMGADVVFAMVTDDAAARAVWLDPAAGALNVMRPGGVAVEVSTVSPAFVSELAQAARAYGVGFVEAPVAGSRPQAEAGQLVFMAGGDKAIVDGLAGVLAPMAAKVLHVGPVGHGALLKLAVNTFFAAQLESIAELLGFLSRQGIGKETAAELLGNFPIVAPPLAGAAKMMAAGVTAPMCTIDLIEKDLGYAIAAAIASGASMPGAERTRTVFQQAQAKGLGAHNISGLAALFA